MQGMGKQMDFPDMGKTMFYTGKPIGGFFMDDYLWKLANHHRGISLIFIIPHPTFAQFPKVSYISSI